MLFKDLMLRENKVLDKYDLQEEYKELIAGLSQDPELVDFGEEEIKDFILKMLIFQFGLAAMIVLNRLPVDLDEEAQNKLLASMGDDVLTAALQRKKNRS